MDANTDGKPYGVDIVMPAKVPTEGTTVDIGNSSRRPIGTSSPRRWPTWALPPLPEEGTGNDGVLVGCIPSRLARRRRLGGAPDQPDRQRAGPPPADVIEQAHAVGVHWLHWPAPPRMPAGMSTTAWISSSHRVTRPAGTPARSRRWCWCRRSSMRWERPGAGGGRHRHRPAGRGRPGTGRIRGCGWVRPS